MSDLHLTLKRTHAVGPRTFGELWASDVPWGTSPRFLCHTLEDEIREVEGQPVEDWKVKGATAIPSTLYAGGPYKVTLEQSPRFGPNTITVNNVPGFRFIRVHAGNDEGDTEGCPLLGLKINDAGIVGGTSRPAVNLVRTVVAQAIAGGGLVWLTVENPPGPRAA